MSPGPKGEHVETLRQAVQDPFGRRRGTWNAWRAANPGVRPDLRRAQFDEDDCLSGEDLTGCDLRDCDLGHADLMDGKLRGSDLSRGEFQLATLRGADLRRVTAQRASFAVSNMIGARLRRADLRGASFHRATLSSADLRQADLRGANLVQADLSRADCRRADFRGARLRGASLVQADLRGADLSGCHVYGVAAWNVKLRGSIQKDLVITRRREPEISVDDLEMAQFLYLVLRKASLRRVIDTITAKVVLILGRFSPERKAVLDLLREELRRRNYLPIVFDFERPASRDLTETVSTLAHMSRFVVAELSDPRSVPHELMAIVPTLPSVPVLPMILAGQDEYATFEHLRRLPWVLPTFRYASEPDLMSRLELALAPAETAVARIRSGGA